jgi:hypothetical protein
LGGAFDKELLEVMAKLEEAKSNIFITFIRG